jgi:hypothetical protein
MSALIYFNIPLIFPFWPAYRMNRVFRQPVPIQSEEPEVELALESIVDAMWRLYAGG